MPRPFGIDGDDIATFGITLALDEFTSKPAGLWVGAVPVEIGGGEDRQLINERVLAAPRIDEARCNHSRLRIINPLDNVCF